MQKPHWYRLGLFGFTLVLFVACASPSVEASAGISIDSIGTHGAYAVGFTSFVLTDMSRLAPDGITAGRPIPVYLWYPVDPESVNSVTPRAKYPIDMLNMPLLVSTSEEWEAMGYDAGYQEALPSAKGPFPVLLVSPGLSIPGWFMMSIGTRLASHGFVVAIASHAGDSAFFGWEPIPDHYAMAMYNRPRDLSFVLTALEERNQEEGGFLHGVIDPSRVAVSGHSSGGYAAIAMVGGDDTVWDYGLTDAYYVYDGPIPDTVPQTATLPDPRIKAIVTLDSSNQELRFDELARVTIPALGLGEEWNMLYDDLYPNPYSWQARQHAAFQGHPNYRVDINQTNHLGFCDLCDSLKIMKSHGLAPVWGSVEEVSSWFCEGILPHAEWRSIAVRYMLAFLKTQLLGETQYQKMLTPGWALTRETNVEFFETEKRSPKSIYDEYPDYFIYFAHQPGSEQFKAEKNAPVPGRR